MSSVCGDYFYSDVYYRRLLKMDTGAKGLVFARVDRALRH